MSRPAPRAAGRRGTSGRRARRAPGGCRAGASCRSCPTGLRDVLLRLVCRRLPCVLGARAVLAGRCPSFVEQRNPLLDALQRAHDLALEGDEHRGCVLVGAPPNLLRILLGAGDDPTALVGSGLRQPALVDQEGSLLLCLRDDALGLLLRLLDVLVAFRRDPVRSPDLLGDGGPNLVDEV